MADLASTLTAEATLHHLDLIAHLQLAPPSPAGLHEVRRVGEALLERPMPEWSDDLGAAAGLLPVFS